MDASQQEASAFRTWTIITLLVLMILSIGAFSFVIVGDRGQPDWDYRPIKDVPGESAYALYPPLPYPQHIRGEKGQ
jgi:hypothetical protein